MFGKSKKIIAELNAKCAELERRVLKLADANAALEKANQELNTRLTKSHNEFVRAKREADRFCEAFEGSLAGLGSLLEEESIAHKRQTEYMRGLKAARDVMEVYVSADKDNT